MRNRLHVGKVGMARYQKWRRSLLIRGDVGLEKNNRLGTPQTIVYRFGFTPSSEVLRRVLIMMKIRKSRMSDFSCGDEGTVRVKKN